MASPTRWLPATSRPCRRGDTQVEYHVYLDQSALLEVCRERSAELCAYRPLGKGQVTSDPVIAEIAEAHGATPAQVALAWLVGQEGVSAVPKASSPERRRG